MTRRTIVAPSVLSADFARMQEAVTMIEEAGGDWIHLDVRDGHFVPNLTFGPKMARDIRRITHLPLDTHLMVDEPEKMIPWFAEAGVDHITFHLEATTHVHRVLQEIHASGKKAGISIVPSTPASAVGEILAYVDIILVMTVNPGFGGQELIPECMEKVRALAQVREEQGRAFHIAVDGGINRRTAPRLREAGADVLVTGSAFFDAADKSEEVEALRDGK